MAASTGAFRPEPIYSCKNPPLYTKLGILAWTTQPLGTKLLSSILNLWLTDYASHCVAANLNTDRKEKFMNRRELLSGFAVAALRAGVAQTPAAGSGQRQMKPLPFDPTKLKGLSEKLLRSHYDNNYAGAFRRLGQIETMLSALPKDAPGFQLKGLKMEELIAANSVILHEQYFGNLGGTGKASGTLQRALA